MAFRSLQPAGVFVERMAGNVKAKRRIFGGEHFVLRPFLHVRQNFGRRSEQLRRAARRTSPCWPLSLRALHFLRALHRAIDHRDHLGAVRAESIHRAGADQAFEHALIQQPRIHRFAEFEEVGEPAERFARRQNSLHRVLADVLDRATGRSGSDRPRA